MFVNYQWLGVFVFVVAALMIWIIRKNQKDKKDFKKELKKIDPNKEEFDNPDEPDQL